MPYKTFSEQINEHIYHLQSQGFDVTELTINSSSWVRCRQIGESTGRGDFAYITNIEKLNNGLCGIKTSCRGLNGICSFKTYGSWPCEAEISSTSADSKAPNITAQYESLQNEAHEMAARKAFGFWQHCSIHGRSDYLDRKRVGCYGIRFTVSEEYGNVAVVPMSDEHGRLWNYQLLNPNGIKRMAKGARTDGLFHLLRKPIDGKPIGIAEGYVTAATCIELGDIPTACAFSSENLASVTIALLNLFPASPIIIYADNDRHLVNRGIPNIGVIKAQAAQKINPSRISLAIPDFGDLALSKDASDWNDLLRLRGQEIAIAQIFRK